MERLELAIGQLMLAGVLLAATLVAGGGIVYLIHHGHVILNMSVFHGEPSTDTTIKGIWDAAIHLSPAGIIQFGLMLLVFVQILRVGLTLIFFTALKDKIFIVISAFVLIVLLYSLFGH